MNEDRLSKWLKSQIEGYSPLTSTWIDQVQLKDERKFLLNQLKELEEDTWWADVEWEWFLERCLDFLGAPK